jgi:hypothetical protein
MAAPPGLAPGPDQPSGDYLAMKPYWDMVETILAGAEAMRKAGTKYLPQFPYESANNYDFRRSNAKFTNIYRDIVENLAAKPFTKEVALVDGASQAIQSFIEDVDGRGNHLHVFSASLFFAGVNDAISWIFVDKAPVPERASLADEQRLGARPYWVLIPAKRLLAVRTAIVDGAETIVHARIEECETVNDGYAEKTVRRIRELNRDPSAVADGYGPARFTLWEEQKADDGKVSWVNVGEGPIAIGVIALVPFITGRRIEGSWRIVPPMQDAAYLQIEHYQQETNLKNTKQLTAFPMLSGNGVEPPRKADGTVEATPVGPSVVLYAPPREGRSPASWTFVEPAATSLRFLADDIKATEQQLRELGRQPLTAQTGSLTVVTTAFAAQKGNSAIQAWCINLKDALENALKFTAKWLADTGEAEVSVHSDFAIDIESDQASTVLLAMRKNNDISREALINEAKRRDWLAPEYDAGKDLDLILAEIPADNPANDVLSS